MQTINISAITLGHIFNDVIDLDKFDRRELELLPVATDFHSFITDIETISSLMAEQKGLTFELDSSNRPSASDYGGCDSVTASAVEFS